jgi:hypothetical protein
MGKTAKRRQPIPVVRLRCSGKQRSLRAAVFTHPAGGVDGTCWKSVAIPTQERQASTKEDIMRTAQTKATAPTRSHRPRAITVFAAAFVAGAAAAVGVNRALDVRLAQSKPRVESEAIFVALRSLPQGAAVTVWDVALRDWPKAMLPTSALRASDTFSGHVLKHPLREGQPLLSIQLVPAADESQPAATPTAVPPPASYTHASTSAAPATDSDLWSPAEPVAAPAQSPPAQPGPQTVSQSVAPVAVAPVAQQNAVPPPAADPAPVAPAEAVAVAAADAPAMTEATGPTASSTTAPSSTTPLDDGVAAAVEAVVAASPSPVAVPPSEPVAMPEPQAMPAEATAPTAVATSPEPAAADDIAEPVVAQPAPPLAPTPVAMTTPTPAAPVERPRPTHSRYLVVPESIAVQADASFVSPAATPSQTGETPMPSGPQTAARSGSNSVRPLPSTATADRGGQTRLQQNGPQNGPQGRQPQRHGRQSQPANPGTPANVVPQPRLGSAMFPNLSAGIEALEGRFRGDQPSPSQTQGQAPTAPQARPLTAR